MADFPSCSEGVVMLGVNCVRILPGVVVGLPRVGMDDGEDGAWMFRVFMCVCV